MTQAAFQLLQKMDQKDLQMQLALQCAPLISGLKIANLLIVLPEHVSSVKELLPCAGITAELLLNTKEKTTFLLCRKEFLQNYLNKKQVAGFLLRMGYSSPELSRIFPIFRRRYRLHMRQLRTFPHEMGLLLGYPLEDVEGFIRHNGKNFLYTGYWKVYENLPEKMELFRCYEQATEHLLHRVAKGERMEDIIRESPRHFGISSCTGTQKTPCPPAKSAS